MTLTPAWRLRIFAAAGAVAAVVLGVLIAHEAFMWPVIAVAGLATIMIVYLQPLPVPTLLLGGALIGYIVGNRGFAQLFVSGNFPLLPAELVLLVGCTFLFVQSAWRREIPIPRNLLNTILLLWIVIGTIRFMIDVSAYGFTAVRDYALVYYAMFFFLAQHAARDPGSVKFIRRCTLAACVTLLIIYPLSLQFQSFFLQTLAVRGVPLILFKGDLAGNFMAMGSLLAFLQFDRSKRLLWLLASLALAGLMLTTNSRSSMVGLAVGAGWLAASGRWKFVGVLGASAVLTALALMVAVYARNKSWEQTPLHTLYERVASIVDPLGHRSYVTEEMLSKSDNNAFRIVWWRASVSETIETNPWFGLGFGHDLAQRFIRAYYPEGNDDFNARSPHNVLITIFARMGFVGLTVFLAFAAAMAIRTWRVLRDPELFQQAGGWWCAAWVLLVCAWFGVVLEGPMGAVVFWTVLGMASSLSECSPASDADDDGSPAEPVLQPRQSRDALLISHSPST